MATTDDSALFVDTNILVYANVTESPLHEQALGAIQAARKDGSPATPPKRRHSAIAGCSSASKPWRVLIPATVRRSLP